MTIDTTIERIKELPEGITFLRGETSSLYIYSDIKKIEQTAVMKEHHRQYKKIFEKEGSFLDRLKGFFSLSKEKLRGLRSLLDFLILFLPRPIVMGYRTIDDFIFKRLTSIMTKTKETKETRKSSTVIIFGLLFLAGILEISGILPPDLLDLSPDAEWVTTISGGLGVVLRLITNQPVKLGSTLRQLIGREE